MRWRLVRASSPTAGVQAWHTRSMPEPAPADRGPVRSDAGPSVRRDRLEDQAPRRPIWRHRLVRLAVGAVTRLYTGRRVEGRGNLPHGPAVLCFSHQNWTDPFFLIAALPALPRCHFFGPEQDDMRRGFRNRLMRWSGIAIPYQPGRRGLVAAIRRAEELLAAGDWVAIAGEGRIHSGESVILPLLEGPAYLALRSSVPLVPVAINGTSWLAFRRRVRIRIGRPVLTEAPAMDRPRPEAVTVMRARAQEELVRLVGDFPDPPRSRWLGGWLTELFNDWPEGCRPPVPASSSSGRPGADPVD